MNWTHTALAQKIRFGCGSLSEAGTLAKELGRSRIMLVTTGKRLQSAAGQRLTGTLGAALVSVFAEARSHVPVAAERAAVGQARDDRIDCLVSFGGGSCSDLGKAVCYFTEQESGRKDGTYFDRAVLPHIAIPTA